MHAISHVQLYFRVIDIDPLLVMISMPNLLRSAYGSTVKYGQAIPGLFRSVAASSCESQRSCAFAKKIERHPLISKSVLVFVLMLGSGSLYYWGPKRTNHKLIKRLRDGSDPDRFKASLKHKVDRSDVVKSIQKLLFESDLDNGKIGVILGPKGSGKSRAVIEACSNPPGPHYILYQEIYQTSEAAQQLAHAAAIPLSRNIFDSIFVSLGLDSQFYYIPKDPFQAMAYVLNKVARRSMEETKTHRHGGQLKYLPCFVIDAAELLAVDKPDIFDNLLRLAQYHIRAKKLRIVLVDSDGITLSKINKSLKHPIVDIVEVEDLKNHDAEQYLTERTKMSSNLAKRLVGLIGGRLLHLDCTVDAYRVRLQPQRGFGL